MLNLSQSVYQYLILLLHLSTFHRSPVCFENLSVSHIVSCQSIGRSVCPSHLSDLTFSNFSTSPRLTRTYDQPESPLYVSLLNFHSLYFIHYLIYYLIYSGVGKGVGGGILNTAVLCIVLALPRKGQCILNALHPSILSILVPPSQGYLCGLRTIWQRAV